MSSKTPKHTLFNVAKVSTLVVFVFSSFLASLALGKPMNTAQALSIDQLDLTPPRAPMNFTAEALDSAVRLNWTSIDAVEVEKYKVYIRTTEEQLDPIYSQDNQVDVQDLENNRLYYFTITALDSDGNESSPSNEVGIMPSEIKITAQKPYTVAAWMPTNWDVEDANEAFWNNLDVYDIISPFWFSMQTDGTLEPKGGARDQDFIKRAQAAGVKVVPAITNNYSTEKTSAVFKSPGSILNHIDIIVNEVVNNGYDGIDIDYENVSAQEKDMYTFFMRNLAEQLHQNNKMLTITTQPKLSDHYNWNGPGAIDWNVAGEVADYLRVMNYDFSRPNTPPGPIAPKEWLRKSMEYALENVPREKILGGIPFYGYDWALTDVGITSGIVWDGVVNTLNNHPDIQIQFDEDSGEKWYEYRDEEGPRKAYFNDAETLSNKFEVITQTDVGGITIWRLGSEDPAIFDQIRKQLGKEGQLYSPARVKVVAKNKSIKVSWRANTKESTAIGHYVYAGTDKENLERVADIKNGHEHIIGGLDNNNAYYVRVTAYNARGEESDASNLVHVSPTDLVTTAPVENLKKSAVSTSSVVLTWSHEEHPDFTGNIFGYDLRYSKNEITESNWFEAKPLPSSEIRVDEKGSYSYFVDGLTPDTDYSFAIKTIDAFQQASSLSNVISLQTLDISPPDSPQNVAYEPREQSIFIQWDAGHDYDLAGYKVYLTSEDGVTRWIYTGLIPSYDLDFLDQDTLYEIKVVALDNNGNESKASESRKLIPAEFSL